MTERSQQAIERKERLEKALQEKQTKIKTSTDSAFNINNSGKLNGRLESEGRMLNPKK